MRSAIKSHRDTWVTEADFAFLNNLGINCVRLPVGYWVLAQTQVRFVSFGYPSPCLPQRHTCRVFRSSLITCHAHSPHMLAVSRIFVLWCPYCLCTMGAAKLRPYGPQATRHGERTHSRSLRVAE